jgi:long-chain acyl-CoA synthetase
MKSLYDHFVSGLDHHSLRVAISHKIGKRWLSRTYRELMLEVESFASGLSPTLQKGETLAILSENRPEWLIVDLATNKLGAILVPIHATANQSYIEYIIHDAEPKILVVSEQQLKKHEATILNLLEANKDLLVVLLANWSPYQNDRVRIYETLLRPEVPVATVYNAVSSIVYTSGTTGEPKGAVLTNQNILANTLAAIDLFSVNQTDSFLSFLPLSHILERTLGSFVPILSGAHIAYGAGIRELQNNLSEIKPTIIISVPRVFEKMRDRIFSEIRKTGGLKEKFFYWSLKEHKESYKKFIAVKLVHKKIRNLFGGRLRFAVTGGAAIHPRIIKFFDHIGLVLIEGYGLTETSPVIAANRLDDRLFGSVGRAFPGVEIKISNDKEVLVRGANVMSGYHNQTCLSQDMFTEDGYFRTGDLGHLDAAGHLTIIGRKKDIIVTSNGKNVYPEKIESLLNLNPYIAQSIVVGHKRNFVGALIVPDMELLQRERGGHLAEWVKVIELEVVKINKELMPHEQIKKIHLLDRQFQIENDELTPTLKIRRHVIENHYHLLIDRLFSEI